MEAAVRGDDFNAAQTVASIAQLRSERAFPAAERIASDSDGGTRTQRHRQLEGLSKTIQFAGAHPRFNSGDQVTGIDLDALHRRAVNNKAAIRSGKVSLVFAPYTWQ